MTVLNVAMVGSDELAREIAKPSDNRDVDTYVHKEPHADGYRILSLIRPAKFPEKLRPLLSALNAAKAGIIEVKSVDASLGEALIAFSSAGIEHGLIIINPPSGEWVDEGQVKMLMKQVGLEWNTASTDPIELRASLYGIMDVVETDLKAAESAPLVIPIDQHFNVKGIGLVAIGYVQSGRLSVHDEVTILPAGGSGNTKSLQVMDDDVECATAGDRVGIALRNTKEEHLSSSSIIVHPAVDDKKTGENRPLAIIGHVKSTFTIAKSPFQKRSLAVSDVIHIAVDLQFVVGRIVNIEDNEVTVEWDSPVYFRRQEPSNALICQLDNKPRIVGRANGIKLE
ncbi:MAG: hypothetical protein QF817_01960 [Candidatus Poseidoniaceae archaeon]|jgi:selenocysteine-specific translation elongation factor|nr:hypothetical protein [Candidatus Poseidoniaceae archaeon]